MKTGKKKENYLDLWPLFPILMLVHKLTEVHPNGQRTTEIQEFHIWLRWPWPLDPEQPIVPTLMFKWFPLVRLLPLELLDLKQDWVKWHLCMWFRSLIDMVIWINLLVTWQLEASKVTPGPPPLTTDYVAKLYLVLTNLDCGALKCKYILNDLLLLRCRRVYTVIATCDTLLLRPLHGLNTINSV